MSSEAFLINDELRVAYNLGKFVGTWVPVDWSRCGIETFSKRILDAWIGEHGEFEREQDDDAPGSAREYAAKLARALFRFCEHCGWRVRVVSEDFFLDEASIDEFFPGQSTGDFGGPGPRFELVGCRWPSAPPMGLGFDLDDSA